LYTFQSYIRNPDILRKAIAESDVKEEDGGVSVNLNITTGTNEKLEELKKILDKETGRSLFPAQVLDILLIYLLRQRFLISIICSLQIIR
jgi:hypothetical protein